MMLKIRRNNVGTYYSPILAVGFVKDICDMESFIEKYFYSNEHQEEMDVSDWLEYNDLVDGGCLNCYSGDEFWIGYRLDCSNPEKFKESFDKAIEKWQNISKDLQPEIFLEVRVS